MAQCVSTADVPQRGLPPTVRPRIAAERPRLKALQGNSPDLLAAQSSYVASLFIYTSGLEALPIGGFTGTTPFPTLSQLEADIRDGQFHLVLSLSTADPRMRWIVSQSERVRVPPGPLPVTARSVRCPVSGDTFGPHRGWKYPR